MKKNQKLITGLALGAAAAAATYLLSTEKGKKARKQMAKDAEQWGEKIGEYAKTAGVKMTDLKDTFSKKVDGLSKDARKRIIAIMEEGKDKVADVKDDATKAANKAKKEVA